jgi:hypothetical protein
MTRPFKSAAGMVQLSFACAHFELPHTGDLQNKRYTNYCYCNRIVIRHRDRRPRSSTPLEAEVIRDGVAMLVVTERLHIRACKPQRGENLKGWAKRFGWNQKIDVRHWPHAGAVGT